MTSRLRMSASALLIALCAISLMHAAALAAEIRFSGEEVLSATNAERAAAGAPALASDERLSTAAQRKAEHLAREGYYAHVSPDGITPMDWADGAGYTYRALGENIAVNSLEADAADIVRTFMESPAHRANLESLLFEDLGVGMATGTYRGKEAVFTVQLFGSERQAPPEPEAPAPFVAGGLPQAMPDLRALIGDVPRPPLATDPAPLAPALPGIGPDADPLLQGVAALVRPLVPAYPLGFSSVTTLPSLAGADAYAPSASVSRFEPRVPSGRGAHRELDPISTYLEKLAALVRSLLSPET